MHTSQAINRTRAIVIAAIAAVGIAGVVAHAAISSDPAAQPSAGHWHHHGPGAHFMHVLKQLNLSAEQQTQIKSIFASAHSQFKEMGASMRSNHEALEATAPTNAAKRIEQMSAVKTQIYAVLTPAQIKQIPAVIAADKAKWQQRHENPAPASTPSTPATSS